MKTPQWPFFAVHAITAAGISFALSAMFMAYISALVLLAVSIFGWWIAWRSIETFAGIIMGVILYLVTLRVGSQMITTLLLIGLGGCAGIFYWAPATLKLTEK